MKLLSRQYGNRYCSPRGREREGGGGSEGTAPALLEAKKYPARYVKLRVVNMKIRFTRAYVTAPCFRSTELTVHVPLPLKRIVEVEHAVAASVFFCHPPYAPPWSVSFSEHDLSRLLLCFPQFFDACLFLSRGVNVAVR